MRAKFQATIAAAALTAAVTGAQTVAVSAQPQAYTLSVQHLVSRPAPDEEAGRALRAFLEAGTGKIASDSAFKCTSRGVKHT